MFNKTIVEYYQNSIYIYLKDICKVWGFNKSFTVIVEVCIGQYLSAAVTFLVQLFFLDLKVTTFCIMILLWQKTLPFDEYLAALNTTSIAKGCHTFIIGHLYLTCRNFW